MGACAALESSMGGGNSPEVTEDLLKLVKRVGRRDAKQVEQLPPGVFVANKDFPPFSEDDGGNLDSPLWDGWAEEKPVGFACYIGNTKDTNQDNFIVAQTAHMDVYGVCDGHGPSGHEAADMAVNELPVLLAESPGLLNNPHRALQKSFRAMHAKMKRRRGFTLSGTTATFVLDMRHARSRVLYVGMVGDSKAVVAINDSQVEGGVCAQDLTKDHTPSVEIERKRITSKGGVVRRDGSVDRVFVKNQLYPGLAMTRSLGDTVAHEVGVSCEPSTSNLRITRQHLFVLLCSDGVWNHVSSLEAVGVIARFPPEKVFDAVEALADLARERAEQEPHRVRDDMTAVCFWLHRSRLSARSSSSSKRSSGTPAKGTETLQRSESVERV